MLEKRDYLAIFWMSTGSSFGRSPQLEEAVDICKRSALDWQGVFDVEGKEVKIAVYDVTGHEKLFWDDRGVHPDSDPKTTIAHCEVRTVTLGKKRRAWA